MSALVGMHFLAADHLFANTTSGYVVGVLAPVILALFLRKSSKDAGRHDAVQSELTRQSTALAVLVQQANQDRPTIGKIPDLDREVAVLRASLSRYERWVERDQDRLRGSQSQSHDREQ